MHVEAWRLVDRELGAPVDHLDAEALAGVVREAADAPVQRLHAVPEIAAERHPLA